MTIHIQPELQEHMRKKGKTAIVVEVIQSDGDFEVTELHVFLATAAQARGFITRRKFRAVPAGEFQVLLPAYRLTLADDLRFGLKKRFCFTTVDYEGIAL